MTLVDLATTTEPSVSAWIVEGAPGSSRYSVRIDVESTTHGAIEVGHWAVVLDNGGNVSEVGRILCIRSELDSTMIHFDHWHAMDPSVPLAVLSLTAPTRTAARLPWDEFLRILPLLGAAGPDVVPLAGDVVHPRHARTRRTR